jgi:galactofuranose transport system substrate-binding protein
MKKNTLFLCTFSVVSIFFLFFLSSCIHKKNTISSITNDKCNKTQIILGFSQIGAESSWRTCNTKSIKEAAAEEGIQLLYANAEQKQENQIKAIRSFIVYRVDVIAFVPIVEDGWDNVLREAKEAHIPVIVVDRKIKTANSDLYAGYIGENAVEEGKNAARFLLKKYEGKNKQYNIMEVRGTDYSSVEEERYLGFREILKNDNRFSIVYSESGDFLRSRGKEIAEKVVKNNRSLKIDDKPIDIIFSHNDAMALGILDILNKYNISAGKDLTIVSIDAEQESIDALKAGSFNCVVECNPNLGPAVMQLVETLVKKNTIPRCTYIQERVFSEYDNLSFTEPRGY